MGPAGLSARGRTAAVLRGSRSSVLTFAFNCGTAALALMPVQASIGVLPYELFSSPIGTPSRLCSSRPKKKRPPKCREWRPRRWPRGCRRANGQGSCPAAPRPGLAPRRACGSRDRRPGRNRPRPPDGPALPCSTARSRARPRRPARRPVRWHCLRADLERVWPVGRDGLQPDRPLAVAVAVAVSAWPSSVTVTFCPARPSPTPGSAAGTGGPCDCQRRWSKTERNQ